MLSDSRGRSILTKPIAANAAGNPESMGTLLAVIMVDPQGNPISPSGQVLDAGPYTKLIDDVAGVLYIGEAAPGTAHSAALWRISRVVTVGDDISKTWAGGSARFNQVWDDRLALSYS